MAALGDVVSAEIETNGWVLQLRFEDMVTGGRWDFGYDTNATPSHTNHVLLAVSSLGFDATLSQVPVARTLRGTKQLRRPYPEAGLDAVYATGSGVVARVALDDFVYANCSNLSVRIAGGLYTAGGFRSKQAWVPVVNASRLQHPRCIAKWSWPPYWRITNDTYQLRCLAFHRSAMNYQPVRGVKFWAVGANGWTSGPVIVTNATVDVKMGDAIPVIEYVATLSASNCADGVWITNHFAAFPWVGDDESVVRTDDGTNQPPSPYYAPYPVLCDRRGGYGTSVAIVAAKGDDAAGRVVDQRDWSVETPSAAFLTIDGAAAAIRSANRVRYQRDNAGGGRILLQTGEFSWTGGTSARGGVPETWLVIEPYPGQDPSSITLTNRGSSLGYASGMDLVRGVKIKTSSGGMFRNLANLWLDGVRLESSEPTSCFNSPTNVYFTRCLLRTNGTAGLNYVHPAPTTFALIRGCTFDEWGGKSGAIQAHTVVGNHRRSDLTSSDNSTPFFVATTGKPPWDGRDVIIAFNKFEYLAAVAGSSPVNLWRGEQQCDGFVFVQNIMEINRSDSEKGQPLLAIAWSSSAVPTSNRVNNVLIWHNTLVGGRANLGEDGAGNGTEGGAAHDRLNWGVCNNLFAASNTKHDTVYTPNGGRVFGWPVLYGVGWSGNLDARLRIDCGPWDFAFFGVPGYRFATCDDARTNWLHFADYRAFAGGTNFGIGGGDYRVRAGSPAAGFPVRHVLPFDIAGAERTRGDASGGFACIECVMRKPHLQNAKLGVEGLSVDVATEVGYRYTLQYCRDLQGADWSFGMSRGGTGGLVTLVDREHGDGQRYYRILAE